MDNTLQINIFIQWMLYNPISSNCFAATQFAIAMEFKEENLTTNYSLSVWEEWKSAICQPNFREVGIFNMYGTPAIPHYSDGVSCNQCLVYYVIYFCVILVAEMKIFIDIKFGVTLVEQLILHIYEH